MAGDKKSLKILWIPHPFPKVLEYRSPNPENGATSEEDSA